jgi:hypothetical protein
MTRRFDDGAIGKDLLLQFVEGPVAPRVVEATGLGSLDAKIREELILVLGYANCQVTVCGANQDWHFRLPAARADAGRSVRKRPSMMEIDMRGEPCQRRER